MITQALIILSSFFVACSAFFPIESYVIVVGSKSKTCFSKRFTESIKVIFEYTVTQGGDKDIDVKITSPNGRRIYNELKREKDEVSFIGQNGDFKFCFSNEFSFVTNKRIAFNIRPFEVVPLAVEAGDKEPKVKDILEAYCDDIHMWMTSVVDYQMKYRVRESIGRYLAERLNGRVMWWSIGQAAVVMLVGFGQVFVFKKFFTDKRSSTKPKGEDAQNTVMTT